MNLTRHRHQIAEAKMRAAKAEFSAAARAALRGDPDAAQRAKNALHDVQSAQADLAALARLSAGADA